MRANEDGSRTELMSPVGSDTRAAALSPLYCGSSAGRARLVQTRSGWERRTFPHQSNTPSREIRKHGAKQDEESQFWQSARLYSVVAGSALPQYSGERDAARVSEPTGLIGSVLLPSAPMLARMCGVLGEPV